MKVSDTLLKEVDLHEWSELIEIQVLGAPAKEVERIVSAIDKHTYSNESLVLKALADIDRLNRSSGLQKVDCQHFQITFSFGYLSKRSRPKSPKLKSRFNEIEIWVAAWTHLFAHDEVNVHCSPAKKVFFFHSSQLHNKRLLEKSQNPREIRTCSLPIALHKC